MKLVLLCAVQVVVFASLASAAGCRNGVCVEREYCLDGNAKRKSFQNCQMNSKTKGVCCGITRISLGTNCVLPTKWGKFDGKCVPASSCDPFPSRKNNVWKTWNKNCSEERSKDHYCCPENSLPELDASKVAPVKYGKRLQDNEIRSFHGGKTVKPAAKEQKYVPYVAETGNEATTESFSFVQNVYFKCRTPDYKDGHCVPLQLCDHLPNQLHKGLSKKKRENALKKYKCSSNAINSTSICCPAPAKSSVLITHQKAVKLGLSECGSVPMDDKVLLGAKAGLGQYPWMANLMYRYKRVLKPQCSGSLIHPRFVLTAAHCNQSRFPTVAVRLGEYDLSNKTDCEEGDCAAPYREYAIDKWIPHSGYEPRIPYNDIALIRLKTEVALELGHIFPICLPLTPTLLMLKPKKLTVTGWGMTENGRTSNVLLKADLEVHVDKNLEECRAESTICARGVKMQGNCKGDSGGPVQAIVPFDKSYRTVLFGIVSQGAKECSVNEKVPGVSVLVGYHIHWILDNMNI